MRRARGCVLIAALLAGGSAGISAQSKRTPWNNPTASDSTRLFYKGYDYGSDAYFSPFTVLLSKGYDIYQLRDSPRDFWSFPYASAWDHGIRDAVRYVGPAVKKYGGWGRFAGLEIYPSSWHTYDWNWVVNYTEHLLGGGVTMRGLDEWYRQRGYPLPRLWAMTTTYAASILNEMTEQPNGLGQAATAGTVADLLIFDVGAITLFHWKQPSEFLSRTLQVADWSTLAAFTYPNKQLQNNGQYITMKVPIGLERTRIFIRGGMGMQFGLSRKLDEEHHLSVGGGGVTNLRFIDATGHEVVRFVPGAGVYYDRNNSLLWSVTSSPAENALSANVYPGVVPGIARNLGFWAVYTRDNQLRIGVVHRKALGLGLGYGR